MEAAVKPAEPVNVEPALERIRAAFAEKIELPRTTGLYRMGLAFVAGWLILVTLGYFLFVAALGIGLYYHATQNTELLSWSGGVGRTLLNYGLYLLPLFGGGVLLLFALGMLFRRRFGYIDPHVVRRENEPVLFEFVDQICKALRAPTPKQIEIDIRVNAAAGFMPGLGNYLRGDLRLVLGLPLIAGMTQKQLAGVIAHEIGHFSQGAGMRFINIIGRNNTWFVRGIYEPTSLDRMLHQMCDPPDGPVAIFGYVGRFFLRVNRWILLWFLKMGTMISSSFSRHMEFDADQYAMRISGSDCIEPMMTRLAELDVANRRTIAELRFSWKERRLADDITMMTLANVDRLDSAELKEVWNETASRDTPWFSTHPAPFYRIERAEASNIPGIFHSDETATALFQDFSALSKRLSLKLYRAQLGNEFSRRHMVSTEELVSQHAEIDSDIKTLNRFSQGVISQINPLGIHSRKVECPRLPRNTARKLLAARRAIEARSDEARTAYDRYWRAGSMRLHAFWLKDMFHAGALDRQQLDKVERKEAKIEDEITRARGTLIAFESELQDRLISALELLMTPPMTDLIENCAEVRAEVARLLPAIVRFTEVAPTLLELQENFFVLVSLLHWLSEHHDDHGAGARAHKRFAKSYQLIMSIRDELGDEPYPFEHGAGEMTIAAYTIGNIEQEGGLMALMAKNEQVVNNLMTVYYRILGRLATVCEMVETAMGLPRLRDLAKPPPVYSNASEEPEF